MGYPVTKSLGVADAATDPADSSENAGAVAFQITGTFVGTITFESTIDGTNYVATMAYPAASETGTTTTTTPGIWRVHNAAGLRVRARMSAYTSGAAIVSVLTTMG